MAKYRLTPAAKADVREIVVCLRGRSPQPAIGVKQSLRDAIQRIGEFPGIGHVREELGCDSLRVWSVYAYLITYRPTSKPPNILRVIHGARDLRDAFR